MIDLRHVIVDRIVGVGLAFQSMHDADTDLVIVAAAAPLHHVHRHVIVFVGHHLGAVLRDLGGGDQGGRKV